jgi:hypothetical protein
MAGEAAIARECRTLDRSAPVEPFIVEELTTGVFPADKRMNDEHQNDYHRA